MQHMTQGSMKRIIAASELHYTNHENVAFFAPCSPRPRNLGRVPHLFREGEQ